MPLVPGSKAPRLAWHAAPIGSVVLDCQGDAQAGLTRAEATQRREHFGDNRLLSERPVSLASRFLAQITDFTVLALLLAAAIALVLGLVSPPSSTSGADGEAGWAGRFGDSLAILAIVLLNAVLGMYQERRAERALHSLRDLTAPNAKVLREGSVRLLPAAELVPGDLVLLSGGDQVPADLRLLDSHELWLTEAALTGESLPVAKDAHAEPPADAPLAERPTMVFMGTQVLRGKGSGIVTNTGMHTELGEIAGLLAGVEREPTPLEGDMTRFGRHLVLGCVAVSALVFVAGLLRGRQSLRELFMVAVALAVAAIPEGLPAVTTIVLALGTQRMALRHALVRRLPAVETLGCTQVICTDKTGTLTQNRMVVRAMLAPGGEAALLLAAAAIAGPSGGGRSADASAADAAKGAGGTTGPEVAADAAQAAAGGTTGPEVAADAAQAAAGATPAASVAAAMAGLAAGPAPAATEAEVTIGDPTDAALLALARLSGVVATGRRLGERPFSSQRRMASITIEEIEGPTLYVRGAPEVLLERCTHTFAASEPTVLSPAQRQEYLVRAEGWARQAMRVIALARRPCSWPPAADSTAATAATAGEAAMNATAADPETGLHLLGLLGLADPPRPEVPAAIAEARAAGIKTLMITGDHPATARAVADEIRLWEPDDLLLTGAELDRLDAQQLIGRIDGVRVVARATAEHKLRIVEALKSRGRICAMTGDGINDAPAVKAAAIGIAMGRTGTDVTKEAASLVLADDNYATIVAAVEEGRAIYANIRKSVFFLLSSNAGCVLAVLVAALIGWRSPLVPVQILWINLITNGLPALALGLDGSDPDLMREPPRRPGGAMLNRRQYLHIFLIGALMAACALCAYLVALGGPEGGCSATRLCQARSICYSILALGPLCHAFDCRSMARSIFADGLRGLFGNRALWGAVGCGVILWGLTIYVPALRPVFSTTWLGGTALLWVAAMSLLPVGVIEIGKRLRLS